MQRFLFQALFFIFLIWNQTAVSAQVRKPLKSTQRTAGKRTGTLARNQPSLITDSCILKSDFQNFYTMGLQEVPKDMVMNPDGSTVIAGYCSALPFSQNKDGLLVKLDAAGAVIWARKAGWSSADQLNHISATSDGGYLAAGTAFLSNAGQQLWVIKFSTDGMIEWSKLLNYGSSYEQFETGGLAVTPDGGFAVALTKEAATYLDSDVMILKFSAAGVLMWTKQFDSGSSDWAKSMICTGDSLVVSGNLKSHPVNGPDIYDGFVMKIAVQNGALGSHYRYDKNGRNENFMKLFKTQQGFLVNDTYSDDFYGTNYQQAITVLRDDLTPAFSKLLTNTASPYPFLSHYTIPVADGGYVGVMGKPDNNNINGYYKLDGTGNLVWGRTYLLSGNKRVSTIVQSAEGYLYSITEDQDILNNKMGLLYSRFNKGDSLTYCNKDSFPLVIIPLTVTTAPFSWNTQTNPVMARDSFASLTASTLTATRNELCSNYPCRVETGQNSCYSIFKTSYGGDGEDVGEDVRLLSNGDYLVAGKSNSGGAGDFDALLMRTNAKGDLLWAKYYGGDKADLFTRSVALADGSFVSLGTTRSFGNPNGEPWLVRTTASGQVMWARTFGLDATTSMTGTNLIVLDNGTLAFTAASNDSTVNADAFVAVTDLNGALIWIKQFNNGKGDRFNVMSFAGDTLYVGGYAELTERDAVLVRLNKNTGQHFQTQRIQAASGKQDEITMIEQTNNGIAFAVWSYEVTELTTTNYYSMLFVREFRSGQEDFNFSNEAGNYSSYLLKKGISQMDKDSGFLYLKNENAANGFPTLFKTGYRGIFEWGRQLTGGFPYHSALSMDIIQNKGYVFTGTRKEQVNTNADILLMATDRLARTGDCTGNLQGNLAKPLAWTRTGLPWQAITEPLLQHMNTVNPATGNASFNKNVSCAITSCDSIQQISDSCSNSFLISYKGLYNHALADVIPLQNGKLATAGTVGFHYMQESLASILGKGGVPLSTRSYQAAKYETTSFVKALETPEGKILLAGSGTWTVNNGASTEATLTLMDSTGTILWSKSYKFSSLDHIMQLKLSGDGGYYMLVSANYGFPPLRSFLVKTDGQGNLIWKKDINGELNNLYFRDFLIENNDLYLVGEYYNENPASLLVAKADITTNTLIWQKRLRKAGLFVHATRIYKAQDSLIITGTTVQDLNLFDYRQYAMLCHINAGTGAFLNGFHINTNNYITNGQFFYFGEYREQVTDRTPNGEFITGQQTILGADTLLTMTRFNRYGTTKWSKYYPGIRGMNVTRINANGSHFYLALNKSRSIPPYDFDITSWALKMTDSGYIKENSIGYCEDRNQPAAIESFVLSEDALVFPVTITSPSDLTPGLQPPYSRSQPVTANSPCSSPSACTLLGISGPDTLCNINDTIVFRYYRNPECKNSLQWITDTSTARVVRITDSTIHVLFRKTGNLTVTVALNAGCTMLSAQHRVFAALTAAELNLGKDSALCPGRTLLLRAGKGFRSYKWQDGSTDSTYTATAPGLYHVTVTDICGNQKSDTVIIAPETPIQLDLGSDRFKCPEDTITLSALPGMTRYQWSPALQADRTDSSVIRIFSDLTRRYYLQVENAKGCRATDSVTVFVQTPPPLDLRSDTSICINDSLVLDAGNAFATYQWSTGTTGSSITVRSPGLYILTARDLNGCRKTDSFRLVSNYPLPLLNLGADFAVCTGTTRQLDAGVQQSYLWSDGSTNRYLTAASIGNYRVRVTNNFGCKAEDSVQLTGFFPNPAGFLDSSAIFCKEGEFEIRLNSNFNRYLWSTGSNTSTLIIKNPGDYWVEVTDSKGCTGRDTIRTATKECLKGLFVPNAFTPNNDRLNNVFKPLVYGNVEEFLFTVYNRYGEKVFETSNHRTGWDGTWKGQPQPSGTFIWTIRYKVTGMSNPESRNGTVILIR